MGAMGAAEAHEYAEQDGFDAETGRTRALAIAPEAVVVRRDARVHAAVALVAGAVGAAYLSRAVGSGRGCSTGR